MLVKVGNRSYEIDLIHKEVVRQAVKESQELSAKLDGAISANDLLAENPKIQQLLYSRKPLQKLA